jgi:hypothetical protein
VLAYAATRRLEVGPVVAIVGGVGLLLLLFVLWRRAEEALTWVVLLLGAAYALTVVVHHRGVDDAAPLVAAGALLCTELASWSCSERRASHRERAVVVGRAVALAALVVAGLAVSALVVALAAAPVGGGLGWTVLGALAAVAVVAIATRLAR